MEYVFLWHTYVHVCTQKVCKFWLVHKPKRLYNAFVIYLITVTYLIIVVNLGTMSDNKIWYLFVDLKVFVPFIKTQGISLLRISHSSPLDMLNEQHVSCHLSFYQKWKHFVKAHSSSAIKFTINMYVPCLFWLLQYYKENTYPIPLRGSGAAYLLPHSVLFAGETTGTPEAEKWNNSWFYCKPP